MLSRLPFLCGLLLITLAAVCCQSACGEDSRHQSADCQVVVNLQNSSSEVSQVCAEVADTPAKRALGLMFRYSLPQNAGMLFIMDSDATISFWMKNTYIPLDIIWINADREIVGVHENATPRDANAITPPEPYRYVLEVNAFYARNHSLTAGSQVSW